MGRRLLHVLLLHYYYEPTHGGTIDRGATPDRHEAKKRAGTIFRDF